MGKNIQTHSREPEVFPMDWASDWGHDRYGYWMAFKIFGIRHCFRWIKPDNFKMGSDENELKRNGDEHRHNVILTQGFWLAETACTQALWEAVMGSNHSRFKGKNRPVETVSYDDCMKFIHNLNDLKTGLDLRLPTEAEWEYACRAGTKTPFSFGENITSDQVNYNGEYPYTGEKKGKYRGETVDVGSLPANPWGLYEMHGNVWEWCSDWYGEYSEDALVDPTGPENGDGRVLRGGSWIYIGRYVRSAERSWHEPGLRNESVGFRLARGRKAGEAG